MSRGYATLYALKERGKLEALFECLKVQKMNIDEWFTVFGNTYSNSVLMKASYDSDIRRPYNEKFEEYEILMADYRSCNYYLELLDER
tara:strand:+ start:220 stop:483 length:264 start_codon:yes stop_codon:yes gene_type:complete